ncbi:M23 family metallopeptidase [Pontibacillus marinus]|uniref:Peptidase M23 n=1 Tax=Pontibacillus marinus BH030004 = DSM 16465 TaxID=1385511 RepID=A0A0A5GCQ8_9BACI|nr:M23 family metallopeptidase [Pontibacillus marinus]KGX90966.1 peptidase M23 [Pontibacillus marinus BH030004 = DSM 16465]
MREEENKNVSKNNWKRILRKKWFFPSVYLVAAALILTGVLWYQSSLTNVEDLADDQDNLQNETDQIDYDNQPATPVMELNENLNMPLHNRDQAVIKTKFFDYSASAEDREKALILYDNHYYQSEGVDIAREDGESFDVLASATGTVTEVKEDPLLGNVVEITHQDGLTTRYMSLGDVLVETGAEVNQDDAIGTAGQSLMGQASGVHVHFEVVKDGNKVNPETYFNQPLSNISVEDEKSEQKDQPEEDKQPEDKKEPNEDSESSISMTNT